MTKVISTVKAIFTRIIFSAHSAIAIWQVTQYKNDNMYWLLSIPLGLLCFEGLFTLAIKKNQEWRWFCPSVFLYLSSVVPSIWLLELDKMERRNRIQKETINFAAIGNDIKNLNKKLGVNLNLPEIRVDAETWVTLIEQFLMLILIVGRWLLPKGDLTRDQLSQLLLVYIGTAADIIEFFDSAKDNKIAGDPLLVFLTLGIWSWSLIQFTIVLSATRSRKPRGGGGGHHQEEETDDCCGNCCCGIDAWGIALNIFLQDIPFVTYRLLIIIHYEIISYMNVFFTCKNTLVILLQLYRLYVVHTENHKHKKLQRRQQLHNAIKERDAKRSQRSDVERCDNADIYIISSGKYDRGRRSKRAYDDYDEAYERKTRRKERSRKDTGYSTASSQTTPKSYEGRHRIRDRRSESESKSRRGRKKNYSDDDSDNGKRSKSSGSDKKRHRVNRSSSEERHSKKKSSKHEKRLDEVTEESDTSSSSESVQQKKSKHHKKKKQQCSDSNSSEE